jgi:hypothetical protein
LPFRRAGLNPSRLYFSTLNGDEATVTVLGAPG